LGVAGSVKAAQWLRSLYPPDGQDSGWLGSLAPDRLAERLVGEGLGEDPGLAGGRLAGRAGRAAPGAGPRVGRAGAGGEGCGRPLEQVLPLVEPVVAGLPADLELLTAISDAIPSPSVALAGADRAVTRRIVSLLPSGEAALRARWLSWLGVTLG